MMNSEKKRQEFFTRVNGLRDVGGFLNPGESPVYLYNEEGRLHSEKEPAYRSPNRIAWYRDGQLHGPEADYGGSMTYFWKGVIIPSSYWLKPKELKLEDVLTHPNAEVRSVGLEIYGYERMEEEGKLKKFAEPYESVTLFSFEHSALHEPLKLLKMFNGTPEPDGSIRIYYSCVPPDMKTSRQAVAWTFGEEEFDYHPILET